MFTVNGNNGGKMFVMFRTFGTDQLVDDINIAILLRNFLQPCFKITANAVRTDKIQLGFH